MGMGHGEQRKVPYYIPSYLLYSSTTGSAFHRETLDHIYTIQGCLAAHGYVTRISWRLVS